MTDMTETFAYVRSLYAEVELDDSPLFTVESATDNVDLSKLSASPKGILKTVVVLRWEPHFVKTVTQHRRTYAQKDGTTVRKDGTKTLRGDLTAEAKTVDHLYLCAQDPSGKVGFRASWDDGKFTGAIVRDPYGIPTELFFDYTPDHLTVGARGKENATEISEDADRLYNDGLFYAPKQKAFAKAGEFTDWLDLWLKLTGHEVKPKAPRKIKAKPVAADVLAENDAALLAGGDWVAG